MELTQDEKFEREILIGRQQSRTRVMFPMEQNRLRYLSRKEFHNHCSNPSCNGYEGAEPETICPKCNSKLFKLVNSEKEIVLENI